MPNYWCYTKDNLSEAFNKFCSRWPSNEFIHDAENEWEWIEGKSNDGVMGFNFSRLHDMGESLPDKPLILLFTIYVSGMDTRELGQMLSNLLSTDIHMGDIKYIDDEKFECNEIEKFTKA